MTTDLPQLGKNGLIVEGIVTTYNRDGTVNIAPMGPIVDRRISRFHFRPFQTSTTYQNLKRAGRGVFHVTDDVMLFAHSAVGKPAPPPTTDDLVLRDACRWYQFEVRSIDDSHDRVNIFAETTERGRTRDFLGFNRAKHAVIEAAILATRVHLLPAAELLTELDRLERPLGKTASAAERQAFEFLRLHIESSLDGDAEPTP